MSNIVFKLVKFERSLIFQLDSIEFTKYTNKYFTMDSCRVRIGFSNNLITGFRIFNTLPEMLSRDILYLGLPHKLIEYGDQMIDTYNIEFVNNTERDIRYNELVKSLEYAFSESNLNKWKEFK